MPTKRVSGAVIASLVLFWIAAFGVCYWLIGTNRYVGPLPAVRLVFSFTLSAFIFLAACKVVGYDGSNMLTRTECRDADSSGGPPLR